MAAKKDTGQRSPRQKRLDQFINRQNGGWETMSPGLFSCAVSELHLALQDRLKEVYRTTDNHFSCHALGAIVLGVTAFDVWTNEGIAVARIFNDMCHSDYVKVGVVEKYRKLTNSMNAKIDSDVLKRLELAVELRHEIVHHLPRPINEEGNVPDWLVELHNLGVFLSTGQETDFDLVQKLSSYGVAYWTFQTLHVAVENFVSKVKERKFSSSWTAGNFEGYKSVCPPERLAEFDAEHSIRNSPENP